MPEMWFHDWEGIVRTIVVGIAAFIGLVLFVRVSGKRTLAKLNAFDLVVTVALGSTLSAIVLQKSVALAEGLTAFGVLILLQFVVTYTSVRWPGFARLVRSEPALLVRDGEVLPQALKRQRLTRDELDSAIRNSGASGLEDVAMVVLESDGTISVIGR